jgi:hypothetical protein
MTTAWIALSVMIVSEAAAVARVEPFWSWNTPIVWTAFILFADSIVFHARRSSWIRSNGREFCALAFVSIPLWLVFEAYNQVIRNWYYAGLPEQFVVRMFGYAWAFSTIWPAIFESAELVAVWRGKREPAPVGPAPRSASAPPLFSALSIAAGALMLVSPLIVPASVAPFMAAPVWLGFIFLLDPINRQLGGASLFADWATGRRDRLTNLFIGGLLCGLLWELVNYWSRAKWHYTVPIMENVKLFEMPLPGYLGFPAFAFECFTMYVFVRLLFDRLIAPRRPGAPLEQRSWPIAL